MWPAPKTRIGILAAMKPRLPNSPAKLVAIALFGAFMTAAPLLLLWLRRTYHPGSGASLVAVILAFLLLMAAGFYVSFRAEAGLTNGIAAERWTASQLAPIRKVFCSRYIIAVGLGLIAVGFILWLMNPRHSEVIWPFILVSQSLTRIFGALKEPRPSSPRPGWRDLTPIHSDHWGQR